MNIISAGVLEVTIALLAVSICVTIPISILYTKLVRRIERSRKRKPNRGAPPSGTPVSSKPEKGFVDIVMREEFFRNTRVFDHHKIDLFQGFECTEGDILEVSYWCGDYVERWHGFVPLS